MPSFHSFLTLKPVIFPSQPSHTLFLFCPSQFPNPTLPTLTLFLPFPPSISDFLLHTITRQIPLHPYFSNFLSFPFKKYFRFHFLCKTLIPNSSMDLWIAASRHWFSRIWARPSSSFPVFSASEDVILGLEQGFWLVKVLFLCLFWGFGFKMFCGFVWRVGFVFGEVFWFLNWICVFVVVLNGGCDLCFCSSLFLFGLAGLAYELESSVKEMEYVHFEAQGFPILFTSEFQ